MLAGLKLEKLQKMTGDESKKLTIRSMKFFRFCLKMFRVYFSVAVAIANRWTMLDIDVMKHAYVH